MNDEERDEVRSTRATGRRREELTFMLEELTFIIITILWKNIE